MIFPSSNFSIKWCFQQVTFWSSDLSIKWPFHQVTAPSSRVRISSFGLIMSDPDISPEPDKHHHHHINYHHHHHYNHHYYHNIHQRLLLLLPLFSTNDILWQLTSFWRCKLHRSAHREHPQSVCCLHKHRMTLNSGKKYSTHSANGLHHLIGLVGSELDHRSLPPEFESRRWHSWRVCRLWLRFITFGGRSAHFAYHVHKSGHKT